MKPIKHLFLLTYLASSLVVAMEAEISFDKRIEYFSLDNIKRELQRKKDETILRASFSQELFTTTTMGALEDYLEQKNPLRSQAIVDAKFREITIQKSETAWFESFRSLHKLIVETAIAPLLSTETSLSQIQRWRSDYISFFFAPTASLSGSKAFKGDEHGAGPYDIKNYLYKSPSCPYWLADSYQAATRKHKLLFTSLFEKLKEQAKTIQKIKEEKTFSKESLDLLEGRGFKQTIKQLVAKIVEVNKSCARNRHTCEGIAEKILDGVNSYKPSPRLAACELPRFIENESDYDNDSPRVETKKESPRTLHPYLLRAEEYQNFDQIYVHKEFGDALLMHRDALFAGDGCFNWDELIRFIHTCLDIKIY